MNEHSLAHSADNQVQAKHSCCGSHQPAAVPEEAAAPLKDVVCGMTVSTQSVHSLKHEGKPVYFCSAGCKATFAADPFNLFSSVGLSERLVNLDSARVS